MIQKLIKQLELEKLKYYLIVVILSLCIYTYSTAIGWKYTGSDTEKWSPDGNVRHYHK